jgi:hypothetical protein
MQYSLDCILIIHVKGLDLISDLIIFKTLKQQSFDKNWVAVEQLIDLKTGSEL